MSHTKEPWSVRERGDYGSGPEADLSVEKEDSMRGYMSLDDARRAVACVNACAGIPNVQLECYNVEFVRIFHELNELCKQRDELLAALEAIESTVPAQDGNGGFIVEYHGENSEYLGSHGIDPMWVVQEMATVAHNAIARVKGSAA